MRAIITSLLFAASALLPACEGHPHHRHEAYVEQPPPPAPEVIVVEQPPAARVEVIPAAPGPNYVWAPGYYARNGNRWVWVEGAHIARPRPGVVWVPGQWVKRPGGWVWVPGHWS
jgi:hypothetical protein